MGEIRALPPLPGRVPRKLPKWLRQAGGFVPRAENGQGTATAPRAPPGELANACKIRDKAKNRREATSWGASLLFLDHAGFVEGLRHAPRNRVDPASAPRRMIAAKSPQQLCVVSRSRDLSW